MASVWRLLASGRSIPGVFGLTLRLGGRWPAVGVCRSLADRPFLSLSRFVSTDTVFRLGATWLFDDDEERL